jgi:thymidylate kinase
MFPPRRPRENDVLIISVSGIDCSGKSTQLEALEEALHKRGHKVHRLWFRPGYSVELGYLRHCMRFVRPSMLPTSDNPQARQQIFQKTGVKGAWLLMAVLDTVAQYGIKLRGLNRLGWTVLCDRYIDDAILDLELKFPPWQAHRNATFNGLKSLCPKPDHAFFLNLGYDEMLKRMKAKNEPFPDAPEIRDIRYTAYETFKAKPGYHLIDATAAIGDVHQQIMQHIDPSG